MLVFIIVFSIQAAHHGYVPRAKQSENSEVLMCLYTGILGLYRDNGKEN